MMSMWMRLKSFKRVLSRNLLGSGLPALKVSIISWSRMITWSMVARVHVPRRNIIQKFSDSPLITSFNLCSLAQEKKSLLLLTGGGFTRKLLLTSLKWRILKIIFDKQLYKSFRTPQNLAHKTTNNFDARIIHTFFSEVKIFVKLDFPR